jgi:hypothetical protein
MMMMMTWSKAAFAKTFVDLNNNDDDDDKYHAW